MTDVPEAPFRWGVTSSSVQVEGVHPAADWSRWERDRLAPRSGDGNGFATNFHDDLALIASLGVTDIRLTIEWARVEPIEGKIDSEALDRYVDIVARAVDVGLAPWLTLHSTSSPGWFSEDLHAWRDDRARDYLWIRHVDRCAERFDALAAGYTPIEDPVGWALRAWSLGSRPPGRRADTETGRIDFLQSVEAALLADHQAARHLKAGGATTMASRSTPTIFRVVDDPQSTLEADAAAGHVRRWAALLFDTWVRMAGDGELIVPDRRPLRDHQWVADFDVLGIGFDHPIGVDAHGSLRPYPAGGLRSDSGFVPLPEELGVQLRRLADRLPGRALAVSTNGVATSDDGWRTQLLGETLDEIAAARTDGVPIVGYFHDTGIDGYEWRAGFDTHRGLIARDRSLRDSAQLYADRIG